MPTSEARPAPGRLARRAAACSGAVLVAALTGAAVLGFLAPPATPPAAPGRAPGLVFRAGARQAYRLTIESTMRFSGAGPEQPRTIQQVLSGTLHLRVLDPGPDGPRAALQFAGASLRLGGASSPPLDEQLGQPFLACFAPDGAPLRLEFPPAVGPEARSALEEAVRTFQVVVPARAGAGWETEESHASGRYRAAYRLTPDGRLLKTKLRYLEGAGAAAGGLRLAVRRAEATIRLAPATSWLERMVVEEELGAGLLPGLFTSSSLRARLQQVPPEAAAVPLAIDQGGGSYRELAAALGVGPAAPQAGLREPDPAPRGLAELVADLEARDEASAAVAYELRDLLRRDPAAVVQLLARLRAGVSDRAAAALLNALGMAGTDEAQAALRTVLGDPAFGRMNRTRAALALGGGPEIEDDSLAALRALAAQGRAEGLTAPAILSLGMAGDTLRRGDSPRYPGLREELVERARGSAGEEASLALLALGNTHDPSVAPAVEARLGDASAEARSAAARALGKVGGAPAVEALAQRLAVEADGTVRFELASALAALPPPGAAALALVDQAAAREPDTEARYQLVLLLGQNIGAYPAARQTLARLATGDPSRRIREYATHVIWGQRP